jgi:hypothetical protein
MSNTSSKVLDIMTVLLGAEIRDLTGQTSRLTKPIPIFCLCGAYQQIYLYYFQKYGIVNYQTQVTAIPTKCASTHRWAVRLVHLVHLICLQIDNFCLFLRQQKDK